ncbi:MAG: response regulator [Verrucomicrobiota bacterium]
MNNYQKQELEDHWNSIHPDKLGVLIIYETFADGMSAKRFSDQVIAKVDNGQSLAVTVNIWSLNMLESPEILNLADIAAATADVVIISVTDTKSLPGQLKDWIAMWTSLGKGSHPFLAALFSKAVNGNACIHEEMRRVAMREGVHLFFRTDHGHDRTLGPPADDHVLVVDDDEYSCVLVGKMLEGLGYHADFASDGAEAVESFLPGKYSAILMDVTMPVMDGFGATRAILEIEKAAGGHVPIIALTANVMTGDQELCLAAGMDDFLSKPLRKAELAGKLDWNRRYFVKAGNHESDCYLEETV